MDEQPRTRIRLWLTVDVPLIIIGLILVSVGVWLGFTEIQPFNLLAKGPQ